MAGSRKQRKLVQDEGSSSSDDSNENQASDEEMEMIQVDFDVKMPEPSDFQGLKNLLHQLFLKAHINTSELANLLIEQRKITGVIKQAADDDMELDAEDADVSFGVFSAINLTEKKSMESISQIRTYLLSHCKQVCADKCQTLSRILEDTKKHVGLIISERMLNIPSKIAVPLYSGLSYDLSRATSKGEAFKFEYFIIICKLVVFKEGAADENTVYANAEEELISEVSTLSFDFSVSCEQDSGLAGAWTDEDMEGKRKRRVLLFPATAWETLNSKLIAELGT